MATSESQKKAIKKYKEKNIELVAFETRKGKSAEYTQAAINLGLGKMEMIRLAVEEFIQRHLNEFAPVVKPAPMTPQPTAEKLSTQERTLLDEFNQLPVDAQKSLIRFLKNVNPHNDADKDATKPIDAPN